LFGAKVEFAGAVMVWGEEPVKHKRLTEKAKGDSVCRQKLQ
jgi:hypothetical protein